MKIATLIAVNKSLLLILTVLWMGMGSLAIGEVKESTSLLSNLNFHGYLDTKFRVRWNEHETDQDIYEYLYLDAGDETVDRVSASMYGRFSGDIDGRRDPNEFSYFREITDTYDNNINGRLYYGYLTIKDVGNISKIRFGRQDVYSSETLLFDGVRVDKKDLLDFLSISLYGGVPAHIYESSPSGDWLWGSGIEIKPREGTLLKLDSIYVEDDSTIWQEYNDELFILSGWQKVSDRIKIYGKYSFLDRKERDVQLGSNIDIPEHRLTIDASYYEQLEDLRNFSLEFSPYYPVAGDYFPFHQYDININKRLNDNLGIGAGATIRELKDEFQETTYNHAFQRYYLSGSVYNLLYKDLNITMTIDEWNTGRDDIRTAGIDGEYTFGKRCKVKAGSYYSLYKYDYYTGKESDDVRTVYAETSIKLTGNTDWKLRYEAEDDDLNAYQTVETSVKYNF